MLNEEQKQAYLDQLFELIRIPSISTLPEHKPDVVAAAEWIKSNLIDTGFASDKIEFLFASKLEQAKHHPVIFAERTDDPSNPTVMIYGHYDVQPVDPIEQWKSDPFEPEIRDEKIFARGANDNKGQLVSHLAALRHMSEQWGEQWPVNVKILFEGEEEAGGENIYALVEELKDSEKLKADVCLISDTPWVNYTNPTLMYGLKGLAYMQIDVKLSDGDMHSGQYGGAVLNPANALVEIISNLRDQKTNRVLIPGFYDNVVDLSDAEREKIAQLPFDEDQLLKEANNAKATYSEEGYSAAEGMGARPTLDINGMWSGFQGEGAKTIIPATAHAKVSMRLVKNQDPTEIAELFVKYVKEIAPVEVDVEAYTIHVGDGLLVNLDSPYVQMAEQALKETFGEDVLFAREGGSIPAVASIQNELGVTPILMGYGLPDDNLHSPNEKFDLKQYYGGIEANVRFLQLLAEK